MSREAVKWAMDDAPMLFTEKGKPDTTARHILAVLAEHANPLAYPSRQQIRFRTGYDERTIQRALARLEDEGLIKREGAKNGCPMWSMALHRKRPASDREQLKAEAEAKKVATAKRVAAYRARKAAEAQVTGSMPVTGTDSVPVTSGRVTDSASVRNGPSDGTCGILRPYVTGATPPEPVVEPVLEPEEEPVADGRRPTTGSRGGPAGGFAASVKAMHDPATMKAAAELVATMPAELLAALPTRTPVINEAADQLAAGDRTWDQLANRIWAAWRIAGHRDLFEAGEVHQPIAVARAMLRPARFCGNVRCDYGTDVDTRQPCTSCAERKADHLASKAGGDVPAAGTKEAPRPDRPTCVECDAPFADRPPADRLCRNCRAELNAALTVLEA